MPVGASLAEVLRRAIDASLAEVWGAAPGTVIRYDAGSQTCDVEVGIRRSVRDDGGEKVVDETTVLTNVPVAFPGAGGFFLSFPLAQGQRVLLVFADRSLDRYLATGEASDPTDLRVLGPAGAVAVPLSVRPVGEKIVDAHPSNMVAGHDENVQTHWTGTEIRLTGFTDTEFVARADRVEAQLSALKAAISGAAVVAGDGGAAFKANILAALAAWPGSTAASKAKVT